MTLKSRIQKMEGATSPELDPIKIIYYELVSPSSNGPAFEGVHGAVFTSNGRGYVERREEEPENKFRDRMEQLVDEA